MNSYIRPNPVFVNRLDDFLTAHDINNTKFAEILGVNRKKAYSIRNGITDMRVSELIFICKKLKFDPAYLLGFKEKQYE